MPLQVMPPPFPPAGSPAPPIGTSHHRIFEKTLFSMMTPEVDAHMTQNLGHVKQVMGLESSSLHYPDGSIWLYDYLIMTMCLAF
eukprot:343204-Pelagomonas_calceolata.AAC.2